MLAVQVAAGVGDDAVAGGRGRTLVIESHLVGGRVDELRLDAVRAARQACDLERGGRAGDPQR